MWQSSRYEPYGTGHNAWGKGDWKGRNPRGSLGQLQEIPWSPKGLEETVEHISPFGLCWLLQASKLPIVGAHHYHHENQHDVLQ